MERKTRRPDQSFNAQEFLDSTGLNRTIVKYPRAKKIFAQGDKATGVCYIQAGSVRLSVLSKTGREAVIATLGPREFFGEGCLAGQQIRMGSATAIIPSTILLIEKKEMVRMLHEQSESHEWHARRRTARRLQCIVDGTDLLRIRRDGGGGATAHR